MQIMANQTSCKLVGMRAFMSIMFEFKKSHANVSYKLKMHMGVPHQQN